MAKKALLYARVSTRNQEDNTSLQNQIDTTRAHAVEQGYQVVDEAREVISGTFVLARTEFNRFLEMIADGRADVIVVDVPDRLGRGEAIANCELLVKMNGGGIEYANRRYDLDTEEGIVMDGADKMISGLERLKIRRRTIRGKKATAEAGHVIASAYRPFGYEFDKVYDQRLRKNTYCNLVIVEEEAEIVRQMYEWCAYEGMTTYRIARKLSKAKIPTITDKDGTGRRKKTAFGTWHRDTVHGILTSTTYKGEWRYGKNRIKRTDSIGGARAKHLPRAEEEQIPVPVPAIVSVELWELTQQRLESNRQRNFKPTKYKYLLRGRVRCGSCGSAMTGHTQVRTKYQAYRCRNKYRQGKVEKRLCNARNVNAARLEAGLWQMITELMTNEELLFSKIEAQKGQAKQATQLLKMSIAALQTQNEKDAAAIQRFLDLFGEGDLSKEEYLQKRAEKERQIERREADIADYEKQLHDATPLPPDREAELRQLREQVSCRLGNATFEQKSKLNDLLQIECIYHDETGQVMVTGVFGGQLLEMDVTHNGGKTDGPGPGGGNGRVTLSETCASFR